MKKELLVMLNAVLIVLLLAACSGKEVGNVSEQVSNGQKVSQGITDTEIRVGITGPQTGPVAEYDKVRKGIQAHFNYINDNGGVNGRKLKLIAYDDQYQPAKAVQSTQRLIQEDKVFSIIEPVGTANITASLPLYKKSGIPVTGVGSGGDAFVNPPIKNMFISQFNYPIEAKIFLDYSVKKLYAKKIAIAYQNDDFGKQSLEALRKTIGKYKGAKIIKEVSFLPSDQDFSSQAQQLKQAKPDVIIMLSTPVPAASLRQEMNKINAKDIPYLVTSTGGMDKNQFNLAGKDVWEGTISAHSFKAPENSNHPEIDTYNEYMTKEFGEESIGALSQMAWAQAQIFVEALKRSDDDLTWENFINKMETFDNWTGSFYEAVTFSPKYHYGNTTLFMVEAKDGELKPISKNIHYDPDTEVIEYE